jgi:integrase/recombinase XerD
MSFYQQFITERSLLLNVSPATISWYTSALKKLPCPSPSLDQLKQIVMGMRLSGMKPTGVNSASRAINAYLHWAGSPHKAPLLREPRMVMRTFTLTEVKLLANSDYDPKLKSLVLLLLDTGCRISEALALTPADIGDGVLTLHGKGNKDRVVPYSHGKVPLNVPFPWTRHRALRLVKAQCRTLGFEPPPRTLHAFRHTFALHYVRHGGSVFHLQAMLGHTTLEMSRRYCQLAAVDLVAQHRSPLTQ